MLGGVGIDLEADLSLRKVKVNHSAAFGKPGEFADGEDAGIVQPIENLPDLPLFRCADEEEVSGFQIFQAMRSFDDDFAIVDVFSGNDLVNGGRNGSSPRTPMTNGALASENADAGHSTKLAKRSRNAAFTSYSVGAALQVADPAKPARQTAATSRRLADRPVPREAEWRRWRRAHSRTPAGLISGLGGMVTSVAPEMIPRIDAAVSEPQVGNLAGEAQAEGQYSY